MTNGPEKTATLQMQTAYKFMENVTNPMMAVV
jgi:hypothetical protein